MNPNILEFQYPDANDEAARLVFFEKFSDAEIHVTLKTNENKWSFAIFNQEQIQKIKEFLG